MFQSHQILVVFYSFYFDLETDYTHILKRVIESIYILRVNYIIINLRVRYLMKCTPDNYHNPLILSIDKLINY